MRELERRWKESGALADGERWVTAVLRETGTPLLPLVSITMQTARALEEAVHHLNQCYVPVSSISLAAAITRGISRPVTPDDMVDFLRGSGDWRRGKTP